MHWLSMFCASSLVISDWRPKSKKKHPTSILYPRHPLFEMKWNTRYIADGTNLTNQNMNERLTSICNRTQPRRGKIRNQRPAPAVPFFTPPHRAPDSLADHQHEDWLTFLRQAIRLSTVRALHLIVIHRFMIDFVPISLSVSVSFVNMAEWDQQCESESDMRERMFAKTRPVWMTFGNHLSLVKVKFLAWAECGDVSRERRDSPTLKRKTIVQTISPWRLLGGTNDLTGKLDDGMRHECVRWLPKVLDTSVLLFESGLLLIRDEVHCGDGNLLNWEREKKN